MRNKTIHITEWRKIAIGSQKELRKLEKKVKELEAKVEQLEKKTNASQAKRVETTIFHILQFATAVIALLSEILG